MKALAFTLAVWTLASISAGYAPAAMITWLDILPGERNGSPTRPHAVSDDGSVIVGFSHPAHAVRWTANGDVVELGDLSEGRFRSYANDVSADGQVIVGGSETDVRIVDNIIDATSEAFRWTAETGMIGLGKWPRRGSYATAVSADGNIIVGGSYREHWGEAFRWTIETGMVGLGKESHALDISSNGEVIVGKFRTARGGEAFHWTDETGMVGLGDLPGGYFDSEATAVSADGAVIVGWSHGEFGNEPFRWTAETGMVGLGNLPGGDFYYGMATAVSADGTSIVGYSITDRGDTSFIWDAENGLRNLQELLADDFGLDVSGRDLSSTAWDISSSTAWGISADGTIIVGDGWTSPEPWMVVIPEPSSGTLALLGLFSLVTWAKKRRSMLTCLRGDK